MTKSVLDVQVSSYDSVMAIHGEQICLLDWLKDESLKSKVDRIRLTKDDSERKELKSNLPVITPSGLFDGRHAEANLISHSGLLAFDIDKKDNLQHDMASLKLKLAMIPQVAYVGYSTSGQGLWGLIPIAQPERHKDHFRALVTTFMTQLKVELDTAPANVASLRYCSYDSNPYFNHSAVTFTRVKERITKRKTFTNPYTDRNSTKRVEKCIERINENRIDITGNYEQWRNLGYALANEFGEAGRNYFQAISQHSPQYDDGLGHSTDEQYNLCLKSPQITIDYFFRVCKDHGVMYN